MGGGEKTSSSRSYLSKGTGDLQKELCSGAEWWCGGVVV